MIVFNYLEDGKGGVGREFYELKRKIDSEAVVRSLDEVIAQQNGFGMRWNSPGQ